MKKNYIVLWSSIIYVFVCFLELFVCNNTSMTPHFSINEYTLVEKVFFLAVILLSTVSAFFLLKSDKAKNLLINNILMWTTFIVLGLLLDLRTWIGIITDNETIVLGVNFIGDVIWISHYIECFLGTITNIIVIFLKRTGRIPNL